MNNKTKDLYLYNHTHGNVWKEILDLNKAFKTEMTGFWK